MNHLDIRAELLRRGLTIRSIARQVGVSQTAVSYVVHRRLVSRRIMDAIAEAIGMSRREVFPEYLFQDEREPEIQQSA